MIRTNKSRYLIVAAYFVFICILFFLPGKAFPESNNWMEDIQFDKWVHVGIFLVLVYLVCWCVKLKKGSSLAVVFTAAVLYGLTVELIQHFFIANRSLDAGDLIADSAGAFAGLWFWRYVKK